MGKKWVKVDPATIKVGDRVRQVDVTSEYRQTVSGVVTYVTPADIEMGGASLSPLIGTWYVRKPKPAKPAADRYDGHGVEYWHNRYEKQLAHSEQLQAANKNRRQKMQLLKKEAKDARAQVQGWESRYGVLSASFVESDYHHAETQAQLDDAMLTIAEKNTELEKWKNKAVALAKQMRADAREAELTRPDEPPVGAFFRINGSPQAFRRYDVGVRGYHCITSPSGWLDWIELTEPGDTITILELTEVGDKRDELFEATEKIAELERSLMDLSGGEW